MRIFGWHLDWFDLSALKQLVKNNWKTYALLPLLFFSFGFLRAQLALHQNQFAQFNGQKIILDGYVCSDPLQGSNNTQGLEICLDSKYSQRILVTTFSRDIYFYGDNIYLIGKIKIPVPGGDFDYAKYLQSKNIYAQIYSPQIFVLSRSIHNPVIYYALRFKHFVYNRFFEHLSKQKAALLIALIIGQKDLLQQNAVAAFNIAGLAHLIAVSGYILTLTLAFGSYLHAYIGRLKTLALCFVIAILYIIMADFAAGVIRAAIMAGIFTASKSFGKQYQTAPSLFFTAALLVFINPLVLKYDIGFMYSFLSIAGIIYFVPVLGQLLKFVPKTFGMRSIIAVTISAQLVTIPISIYYFHQLSLVAPLTNLMVIPVVEICLCLGYLLCFPLIGFLAAQLLIIILNYILVVVSAFAAFKYSALIVSISWQLMLAIYALEIVAYFVAYRLLKAAILFDKMSL